MPRPRSAGSGPVRRSWAKGARRIRQFAFSLYALIRLSPIVIAGHHQESESSEFIMSATTGLNTSLNLMR